LYPNYGELPGGKIASIFICYSESFIFIIHINFFENFHKYYTVFLKFFFFCEFLTSQNSFFISKRTQLTNLLTSWSRVFNKLLVDHLLNKASACYGTGNFIICSQQLAIAAYSQPDESSPHTLILFL
jgi:hypothetical protein